MNIEEKVREELNALAYIFNNNEIKASISRKYNNKIPGMGAVVLTLTSIEYVTWTELYKKYPPDMVNAMIQKKADNIVYFVSYITKEGLCSGYGFDYRLF